MAIGFTVTTLSVVPIRCGGLSAANFIRIVALYIPYLPFLFVCT